MYQENPLLEIKMTRDYFDRAARLTGHVMTPAERDLSAITLRAARKHMNPNKVRKAYLGGIRKDMAKADDQLKEKLLRRGTWNITHGADEVKRHPKVAKEIADSLEKNPDVLERILQQSFK